MIHIIDNDKITLVTEAVQLHPGSTWILLINVSKILKLLTIDPQETLVMLEVKLLLPSNVSFIPPQGEKILLKDHKLIDDIKLSWKIEVKDKRLYLNAFKIQITT